MTRRNVCAELSSHRGGFDEAVRVDDGGVTQPCHGAGLAAEPPAGALGILRYRLDTLERHRTVEAGVVTAINLLHASFAEAITDAVGADMPGDGMACPGGLEASQARPPSLCGNLSRSRYHNFGFPGLAKVRLVVTPSRRAENARGRIHLADGHLKIEDFLFPTASGRLVVGELDVDFNSDPYVYALTAQGDPLNTNVILGAATDSGFGPASLNLAVTGDGSEDGHLAGGGSITVVDGELPVMPVLSSLEQLVTGTRLIGSSYDGFEIRFRIGDGRLEIEPFEIRVGELQLAFGGSVELAGGLALATALRMPREGAEALDIPKEVIEALTDKDGRVNLPIAVGGSQESPQVEFDRSGWGRMARGRVESEVKKELGKMLGELFSKDKEDEN